MDTVLGPGAVLLGKYRIEKVLGRGGMGVVVAARHIELGHLFAIKCLLPGALSNEEVVQRFLREARAAAGLESEHVARVVDFGRLENGVPYMVMEYLSGCDLRELVRARGPLPVEEAVALVLQASEAIAEAHAMGIVHRDIKPANLFLVRRPNGAPCIKVLDFGISKQVDSEGLALTRTGALVGSPLYMSPEQMRSRKDISVRSDIWAMGVVLYERCTAKAPFDGQTVPEIAIHVVEDEPLPPSAVLPGLPPELDTVIGRCLQKRPEDRYGSIQELAEALLPLAGMRAPTSLPEPPISFPGQTVVTPDCRAATVALSDGPSETLHGSVGESPGHSRRTSRIASIAAVAIACAGGAFGAMWLSRSLGSPAVASPAAAPSPGLDLISAASAAPAPSICATPVLAAAAAPEVTPTLTASVTEAPAGKPSAAPRPTAGKAALPRARPPASAAVTASPPVAAAPSVTAAPTVTVTAAVKKPEGIF